DRSQTPSPRSRLHRHRHRRATRVEPRPRTAQLARQTVSHHDREGYAQRSAPSYALTSPDRPTLRITQHCSLGSSVSPVLANLFMHYAFDAWMAREHPTIPFERYCDDAVV